MTPNHNVDSRYRLQTPTRVPESEPQDGFQAPTLIPLQNSHPGLRTWSLRPAPGPRTLHPGIRTQRWAPNAESEPGRSPPTPPPAPSGPLTLRFLTQNHEAEARDRLPTRNSIQLGFQTLARILDSHPGSKPRGGLQPRLRSPPRNHDREARGGRQTRVRPRAPHQQPWWGGGTPTPAARPGPLTVGSPTQP